MEIYNARPPLAKRSPELTWLDGMELELVEEAGLGLEKERVEAPGGEQGWQGGQGGEVVGEGVVGGEGRGLPAVEPGAARQQALAQTGKVHPLTLWK